MRINVLGAVAASMVLAQAPLAADPKRADASGANIERGRYLALAADCVSCHTAPNGKPFAGGNALKTPFGIIYGTNITPDPLTGIGQWSREDFERALRQGVRKDGAYLYPAMPYGSYTKMSDADVAALWAFMRSVPTVNNAPPSNTLPFPFSVRSGLAAWRGLYFTAGALTPTNGKSAAWNRGEYLVTALGHCNECHTPRSLAQGLEPAHELTGAEIQGWYAPDISSGPTSSIRDWSSVQLMAFLKTGAMPNNATVVGPMQEVISNSLKHLTDADRQAMTTYLKDQPGHPTPERGNAVKFARVDAGEAVYQDNCSSCHQADGRGIAKSVPGLAGNDAVVAREPYNVIMAVLEGFAPQGSWGAMGSFADTLSDDQIADVTNYVRTAWNNQAPPNATPWSVSTWRKQASAPHDNSNALLCPEIKDTVLRPALALGPSALQKAATSTTGMTQLVNAYKASAPQASRADVVEGLSTAYCRSIANEHLSEARMSEQLSDFAQQVAVSLRAHGSTG